MPGEILDNTAIRIEVVNRVHVVNEPPCPLQGPPQASSPGGAGGEGHPEPKVR